MNEYQLTEGGVQRLSDGAFIPDNPHNSDWKTYQAWLQAGGVPRPLKPGPTYIWSGTAWVEDPALAQDASNSALAVELTQLDADSVRSNRALLMELAKVAVPYPPPPASDRHFLLESETRARQLRSQLQPVTVLSLTDAKNQRIWELRNQLLAYVRLGFIVQGVLWSTDITDMVLYMTLAGYQTNTPDGKVHVWDADHFEHALTPLEAVALSGALFHWLYLAQSEAQSKVGEVKACTTVEQVQAVNWIGKYTSESPYNADIPVPDPGFTTGFDNGFGGTYAT